MLKKKLSHLTLKKQTPPTAYHQICLKHHFDIYGPTLHNLVNETFQENIFPEELKLADIHPSSKKKMLQM